MQEGRLRETDSLGARLNKLLDCPVRFPGFGGDYFICGHDVSFLIPRLLKDDRWDWVKERHERWTKKKLG